MARRRASVVQPMTAAMAAVAHRAAIENGKGLTLARNQTGQIVTKSPIGLAMNAPRSGRRPPTRRASGAKLQVKTSSVAYQRTESGRALMNHPGGRRRRQGPSLIVHGNLAGAEWRADRSLASSLR